MLTIMTALLITALQDDHAAARERAEESRKKVETLLRGTPTVKNVSIFGVGETFRVVVTVEHADAQAAVREQLGEAVGGVKIIVVVATPLQPEKVAPVPVNNPAPPPLKKEKLDEPARLPDPLYKGLPDCDIILDHYKVKPPSRWKEGYKCQYIRRSVIPTMGFGGWTYDYTKHRPQCPVRNGRVGMPSDADDYVKWVYTKGYTEVFRGGFLFPNELRGSDAAWAASAEADLRSRLPKIRAWADWDRPPVSTKGFQKMINQGYTATPGWGMRWVPPAQWSPPPVATGPGGAPPPTRSGGGCGGGRRG